MSLMITIEHKRVPQVKISSSMNLNTIMSTRSFSLVLSQHMAFETETNTAKIPTLITILTAYSMSNTTDPHIRLSKVGFRFGIQTLLFEKYVEGIVRQTKGLSRRIWEILHFFCEIVPKQYAHIDIGKDPTKTPLLL